MCFAPSYEAANAGCPGCNGNLPSCTWDTNGVCPTSATILLNSQVIAGTAAVGASTDLSTLVKPRFLAVFERVPLGVLTSLFNRPAKGTAFVMAATTPIKAILDAVRQGRINLNTAISEYAGFIDVAEAGTDGAAKTALLAKLTRNFNMLSSSSSSKAFVETPFAGDEGEGVWSYISWLISYTLAGTIIIQLPRKMRAHWKGIKTKARPTSFSIFLVPLNILGIWVSLSLISLVGVITLRVPPACTKKGCLRVALFHAPVGFFHPRIQMRLVINVAQSELACRSVEMTKHDKEQL